MLYDQLCNEETAYKFYDDLIEAIERRTRHSQSDRERLLAVLSDIREDEAEGVEDVTDRWRTINVHEDLSTIDYATWKVQEDGPASTGDDGR